MGRNGNLKSITFYLIAKSGHGPFIPSTPAILCAKMLARGEFETKGAFPCIGILSLNQYLDGLKDMDIKSISSPALPLMP